jgi:hypothetical protein
MKESEMLQHADGSGIMMNMWSNRVNKEVLFMRKIVVVLIAAIVLIAASGPAFAADAENIPVDVLIIRPITLVGTVLGTALFVVSLPFSIPSGSVKMTARKLIVKPFKYTFTRPLGEFDEEDEPRITIDKKQKPTEEMR